MEAQVCQKRKKYKDSPLANSLLPPQHHHRHLEDAIPSRPPLGDLSSPKEVGEPHSPRTTRDVRSQDVHERERP